MTQENQEVDTFLLCITADERKMLLNSICAIGPVKQRIQVMKNEGETFSAWWTLDEIDELNKVIRMQIELIHSRFQRRKWDRLFQKVDDLYKSAIISEEDDRDYHDLESSLLREYLPDDIFQKLRDSIHSGRIDNLEELNAHLSDLMKEYNRRPQEEMAGLSPEQAFHLIYTKWDDPNGPFRLNASIPAEELSGIKILTNAKILLKLMLEEGKVKATGLGYLNRKFVKRLYDEISIPEDERDTIAQCCKVINEFDSHSIHIVCILLKYSNLIRCQKGYFNVTRKGREMLKDGMEGALYHLLFVTFYRTLDIDSFYGFHEGRLIQQLIAFSFFALKQFATDWINFETLTPKILLPAAQEVEISQYDTNPLLWLAESRIIMPLEWFGLIERRDLPNQEKEFDRPFEVRLTPLFQRFMSFYLTDKSFH